MSAVYEKIAEVEELTYTQKNLLKISARVALKKTDSLDANFASNKDNITVESKLLKSEDSNDDLGDIYGTVKVEKLEKINEDDSDLYKNAVPISGPSWFNPSENNEKKPPTASQLQDMERTMHEMARKGRVDKPVIPTGLPTILSNLFSKSTKESPNEPTTGLLGFDLKNRSSPSTEDICTETIPGLDGKFAPVEKNAFKDMKIERSPPRIPFPSEQPTWFFSTASSSTLSGQPNTPRSSTLTAEEERSLYRHMQTKPSFQENDKSRDWQERSDRFDRGERSDKMERRDRKNEWDRRDDRERDKKFRRKRSRSPRRRRHTRRSRSRDRSPRDRRDRKDRKRDKRPYRDDSLERNRRDKRKDNDDTPYVEQKRDERAPSDREQVSTPQKDDVLGNESDSGDDSPEDIEELEKRLLSAQNALNIMKNEKERKKKKSKWDTNSNVEETRALLPTPKLPEEQRMTDDQSPFYNQSILNPTTSMPFSDQRPRFRAPIPESRFQPSSSEYFTNPPLPVQRPTLPPAQTQTQTQTQTQAQSQPQQLSQQPQQQYQQQSLSQRFEGQQQQQQPSIPSLLTMPTAMPTRDFSSMSWQKSDNRSRTGSSGGSGSGPGAVAGTSGGSSSSTGVSSSNNGGNTRAFRGNGNGQPYRGRNDNGSRGNFRSNFRGNRPRGRGQY